MNINDNIPNRNNINNQKLRNQNSEKPSKSIVSNNNASLANLMNLKKQIDNLKNKKAEPASQNYLAQKSQKELGAKSFEAKQISSNFQNYTLNKTKNISNTQGNLKKENKALYPKGEAFNQSMKNLNALSMINNYNHNIINQENDNGGYCITQNDENEHLNFCSEKINFESKKKNNKIFNSKEKIFTVDIKNKNDNLDNLNINEKENLSKSKERLLSEKFKKVVNNTCFQNFNSNKLNSTLKKKIDPNNKSFGDLKNNKAINKNNLSYKAINTTENLNMQKESKFFNSSIKDFSQFRNLSNLNDLNINQNRNIIEKLNKKIVNNQANNEDYYLSKQGANKFFIQQIGKDNKNINIVNNMDDNNNNSINYSNPYIISKNELEVFNMLNTNGNEILSKTNKEYNVSNNDLNLRKKANHKINNNSYAHFLSKKKDFIEENFNLYKSTINFETEKEEEEIERFETKTENTEDEIIMDLDQYKLFNTDFICKKKGTNFVELNSSNDLIEYKNYNQNEDENDFNANRNKNNKKFFNSFKNVYNKNQKSLKNQSAYLPNKRFLDSSHDNFFMLNSHGNAADCFLNDPINNNKEFLIFTSSVGNLETKVTDSFNRKNMNLFFHNKLRKNMKSVIEDNLKKNTEVNSSKPSLDFKYRSVSNFAKNPLISKHFNSKILTLNSEKEDSKLNSKEEEKSSIIDSDENEEKIIKELNSIKNKRKNKNSSIKGKVNLKKLNLQISTEELLTNEEQGHKTNKKKLNYHRRKKSNLNIKTKSCYSFDFAINTANRNYGNLTSKYLKGREKVVKNSKSEFDNGNLLKKFSLWKAIDSEITNANFEDLINTIKILEFYIKVLKEDYKKKETATKLKIEKLQQENLDVRLENKTLHNEIKHHKTTIYNIYKRSIEFEHFKIIEDKEIILTISKLLKENEYLRKIVKTGELYAEQDYNEMFNNMLNNPGAEINKNNFEQKMDALFLRNKTSLKREKSQNSVKRLKTEFNPLENNYENENNDNYKNEFICEIEKEEEYGMNIEYENEEQEIKALKNIGNLANICSLNCDFFDKKKLSKSSRNLGKANKAIVPKIYLKSIKTNKNKAFDTDKISNNNLISERKNLPDENVKNFLNESLEGLKKKVIKNSRNDNFNDKLQENQNFFNDEFNMDLEAKEDLSFDGNIKGNNQLIKIEDQAGQENGRSDCDIDITIIEVNRDGKSFSFDNSYEERKLEEKVILKKTSDVDDKEIIDICISDNDYNNVNTYEQADEEAVINIECFNNINYCYDDGKTEFTQGKNYGKVDEKIYTFKNEFVNKLSNKVKSDEKIGSIAFQINPVEKTQKHILSKIIQNEKKQKLQFPKSTNLENKDSIMKVTQLRVQEKKENFTNEKIESTNFTTDFNTNSYSISFINQNIKWQSDSISSSINHNNNFGKKNIEEKEEEILEEKSFRENLIPISRNNSDLRVEKNTNLKLEEGIEAFYLFSNTPREKSENNE